MKVSFQPKPQSLVNAFLIFFIVHSMQVGVGVQGFQRIIYMEAKHDAWISVIIGGIATQIVAWVMVKTLRIYDSSDLYGIQYDIFGKWLGNLLNLFFVLYCLSAFYVIIRNYIEVIQAWVFPDLPTWFLSLTLILLVGYGLSGGFRTIVGVSFFSVVGSLWVILLLGFPIQFSHVEYLFPLFEASIPDLLRGAKQMTFTVLGFEIIYFAYPFLKEKDKVNKYMQLGMLFTNILFLVLMVVSLTFFSGGQLERTVWGTLSMFKIVRLPFIERFEYVAITYWIILIIPNLLLYMWAACRGFKRMFNLNERKVARYFLVLLFATIQFPLTRIGINMANDYFAKAAFYLILCYPPLLFFIAWIKMKLSKSKEESVNEKS
ncbi:GerAB/ArcD/ProY family transporter [Heyndrickxia sp. MSNUG]|uniref:GerAB/ArcD/ProY family transporter n=1 Tax=Bacillaceae TaxID=186817 RepID=UPI002FFF849A